MLWRFSWSNRFRCCWRNLDPSSASSDDVLQLGLLWCWLVSFLPTRYRMIKLTSHSSVVFQWTISYMISPDAANLGVKAVYVWAGLLVPTTILLWMFYPEVGICCLGGLPVPMADITCRPKDAHTGSWMSSINEISRLGSSRRQKPFPSGTDMW